VLGRSIQEIAAIPGDALVCRLFPDSSGWQVDLPETASPHATAGSRHEDRNPDPREDRGPPRLTGAQLMEQYREDFSEQSRSNHKQFLFRRIARRI
jgi:hypothetical protein